MAEARNNTMIARIMGIKKAPPEKTEPEDI
jgi:hypothetical protein